MNNVESPKPQFRWHKDRLQVWCAPHWYDISKVLYPVGAEDLVDPPHCHAVEEPETHGISSVFDTPEYKALLECNLKLDLRVKDLEKANGLLREQRDEQISFRKAANNDRLDMAKERNDLRRALDRTTAERDKSWAIALSHKEEAGQLRAIRDKIRDERDELKAQLQQTAGQRDAHWQALTAVSKERDEYKAKLQGMEELHGNQTRTILSFQDQVAGLREALEARDNKIEELNKKRLGIETAYSALKGIIEP